MSQSSFLPEDYIAQRAERRSSVISLTLFAVVMISVVGAFFVTNRQWSRVKIEQAQVTTQYAEAARRIDELEELEAQKDQLIAKAEIVAALIDRVPRSILLAELINRMPQSISLQEFLLKSTKVKKRRPASATKGKVRSLAGGRSPTKAEEADQRRVEAPRYHVTIMMIGVAPTDLQVSEYLTSLGLCPLVQDVELKYSREKVVDGESLRLFRIEMVLDPLADAKQFEPLKRRRDLRDPTRTESIELDSFDPSVMRVKFPDDDDNFEEPD